MALDYVGLQKGEQSLPLGRRVPRGRLRWYLASCPEGEERVVCDKVKRIVSPDVLVDAFVPRRERHYKDHGEWKTDVVDLFEGYFLVATADAAALSRELAQLSFPVRLAGSLGRGYAPLDEEAAEFLREVMDDSHVVRLSTGEIVANDLRILEGPLVGKESRVSRIIRRKALARVRLSQSDREGATLSLPLSIPVRR